MTYTGISKKLLSKFGVEEGDNILVRTKKGDFEGILMPRTELGDDIHLVIKLKNGYNIGVEIDGSENIERISKKGSKPVKVKKIGKDQRKPTISIIHTGGTIASKVDYRTGGVVSAFTPEELIEMFPGIEKIANINARLIANMWSGNMRLEHHQLMAKEIKKEIKKGVDGIIIGHGTDTMHYSAASLSFLVRDSPIPILFVGAQRSSDRGSTDAELNLLSAVQFIAKSDFSGVAICMHGSESDDFCYIHPGTKVRKLHTSRRDAFKTVNSKPFAKVWADGKIEYLRRDYPVKDKERKPKISEQLEKRVALVKLYPGFEPSIISHLQKKGVKGIVLEGTGLGHAPVNKTDKFTSPNAELFTYLKNFIDSGGTVVMTSQCLFGRVQMNVYSYGRDLLSIGVIQGEDMLPETAYVKLAWVLAQTKNKQLIQKMILTDYAGEITKRTMEGWKAE